MENNKKAPLLSDSIKGLDKKQVPVHYTTYTDTAEQAIDNGYPIVPIVPGYKYPKKINGWQERKFNADAMFIKVYKNHGLGIQTGKIINKNLVLVAIDIDVYNEKNAQAAIKYCIDNFGYSPLRKGAKGGLLFYLSSDIKKKIISKDNRKNPSSKIEILSKGQQAVAFHIHPDTGKPYSWPDGKTILDIKACDLPVIDKSCIDGLFSKFYELEGLKNNSNELLVNDNKQTNNADANNDPFENLKSPIDIPIDEAKVIVNKLDPDMKYDQGWYQVGMGLWHEFRGSIEAFEIWDEWSQKGAKYDPSIMQKHWKSFKHDINKQEPISFRSIIDMAKKSESQLKLISNKDDDKNPWLTIGEIRKLGNQEVKWLINGVIARHHFGEIFALPKCFKTFIALDWSLSIAAGKPWFGHPTEKSLVLYIFGEGIFDIGERIDAWLSHHEVTNDPELFIARKSSVDMTNTACVNDLIKEIERIVENVGHSPGFIVIDTLARSFGASNENSTVDMNTFINNIQLGIQTRFDSTILVVHHMGKSDKVNSRGSIALEGAVDFEYRLDKFEENKCWLVNKNQRNRKVNAPICIEMKSIGLPNNNNSLVPVLTDAPIEKTKSLVDSKLDSELLQFVEEKTKYSITGGIYQNELVTSFVKENPKGKNEEAIRKVVERLRKEGLILWEKPKQKVVITGAKSLVIQPIFGSDVTTKESLVH